MTLGGFLKQARSNKGMSLRDVERVTTISNGYLSLLESDSVKNPSPNFLFQLSSLYAVSYGRMMTLAGYVVPQPENQSAPSESEDNSWLDDLTEEERTQVGTFVRFLRASRPRRR